LLSDRQNIPRCQRIRGSGEAGEIHRMTTSSSSGTPAKPAPFARELIEKEIAHLKKGRSVRDAQEKRRGRSHLLLWSTLFVLVGLYSMDTVIFSYDRGDAIRVYLYLHNYGDDKKAAALADCGLLTPHEVRVLDQRQGSFQDYFTGTGPAEARAAQLIEFMNGVHALHENRYNDLSPLNKIRYFLFIKTGLTPPIRWDVLNSSIDK
jgi:hypothetical protein